MRRLLLALLALLPVSAHAQCVAVGKNYQVEASSDLLARRILYDAERHRQDFARQWLGRELKDWAVPIPMVVKLSPKTTPNGFQYGLGRIIIYVLLVGSVDTDVDSILRHEVGHTVITREFDRDAPRWLHEGVCVADELLSGTYPARFREHLSHFSFSDLFELDQLLVELDGDGFYGQSASLVCYVRRRWGTDSLWQFACLGQAVGWEGASAAVFHTNLQDLHAAWSAWVTSLESPYPRTTRGTK